MTEDDTEKKKVKETYLKVVMRRLPPDYSENEFNEMVKPFGATITSNWFCEANKELKPFSFSRAYLVFKEEKDAFSFCEEFKGKMIKDKNGFESFVIVERAPNQGIPSKSYRPDKRVNTLKDEYEYKKFLDEYSQFNVKKSIPFESLVKELEEKRKRLAEGNLQPTPLLEYLVEQELKKSQKTRKSITREYLRETAAERVVLPNKPAKESAKQRSNEYRNERKRGEKENKKKDSGMKANEKVSSSNNNEKKKKEVSGERKPPRSDANAEADSSKKEVHQNDAKPGSTIYFINHARNAANGSEKQDNKAVRRPIKERKTTETVKVINGEKRSTEKKTADKNREKTIEKQSNDRKVDGDGNRRNRDRPEIQRYRPKRARETAGDNSKQQQDKTPSEAPKLNEAA